MNDVVIVGAGPAGIGVAHVLKKMGIHPLIIEKDSVGASFKQWPKEMRFISPSFSGNSFSMPDLNTITPDSSPAFMLKKEHPSGHEYAEYLETLAQGLDIQNDTKVIDIVKDSHFTITTSKDLIQAKYLIWAAGEFMYPKKKFIGADLCIHNTEVLSWKEMQGEEYVIIGAYESGFDAAIQLAATGKKVILLDSKNELDNHTQDSSYSLSPYTRERYLQYQEKITHKTNAEVEIVSKKDETYVLSLTDGSQIFSKYPPINATGFETSLVLVSHLFDQRKLTPVDESTITQGLFLVGPQVQHSGAIFCFIYKFRQRFAVVAKEIAQRLGASDEMIHSVVEEYKQNNFYYEVS